MQRLPIEAISQASANQRSGRCGRVEAGIAIRLYSEEDFEGRPEFTDPEILRTNLASVILQMTVARARRHRPVPVRRAAGPAQRARPAYQLLEELGAISTGSTADAARLTRIGRRLARLPIDPRLGRMILEAERLGCVREILVIAAALSLQDPRERPVGPAGSRRRPTSARAVQGPDGSDFLTWLNLWRHLREQQRELSSSAFRRMCKREYLNYLRVREWQDFESQLRQVCKELKVDRARRRPRDGPTTGRRRRGATSTPTASTRRCCPACCRHVGVLEERESRDRARSSSDARARASTSAPAARGSRSSPAADCAGRTRRT